MGVAGRGDALKGVSLLLSLEATRRGVNVGDGSVGVSGSGGSSVSFVLCSDGI